MLGCLGGLPVHVLAARLDDTGSRIPEWTAKAGVTRNVTRTCGDQGIGAHQGSPTSCDPGSPSAALPLVIDARYGGCCWCFVTAPQEAAATVYCRRTSLVLADWMIAMATSRVEQPPAPKGPASRPTGGARIGWVVAGSLVIGLVAALLLPFAPFVPAEESAVTGAVLCGFALGWAMLAVLSVRFTDQPQRWAAVPALFMGLGGLLLIAFGSSVHPVLDWVWPPALLALAIWMFVRVHRELPSRSGRILLYPVIGFLAVAAIGGAYQTVGAAADARAYP